MRRHPRKSRLTLSATQYALPEFGATRDRRSFTIKHAPRNLDWFVVYEAHPLQRRMANCRMFCQGIALVCFHFPNKRATSSLPPRAEVATTSTSRRSGGENRSG